MQLKLCGFVAVSLLAIPVQSFSDPAAESDRSDHFNPQRQLETITRHRSQIENLETRYGPYDYRLKEALKGLGFQLKQVGDLPGAKQAYSRALHVTRVNDGLYNETQIGIVERLIDVDVRQRDWESVDKHYAYLEHLYKKLYDLDDPRLEDGLRNVVAWHLDASNINLSGNRVQHLGKARDLLKLRLQVAELTLSGEDPLFDSLRQSIRRSEYYYRLYSGHYGEFYSERSRGVQNSYAWDSYIATLD